MSGSYQARGTLRLGDSPDFRLLKQYGAPPARTRLRMVTVGDSKVAQGTALSSTTSQTIASGFQAWIGLLTRQRVEHRPEWNLAVGGTNLAQIAATVPAALALKPDILLFEGGTNDLTAGASVAAMVETTRAAIDLALASGRYVVAMTIPPRSYLSTTDLQTRLAQYNFWLRSYRQNEPRLFVADIWRWAGDANGNPTSAANLVDGLHESMIGARLYALAIVDAIQPLLGNVEPWLISTLAEQATTTVPYGNLVLNGLFDGTGGTVSTGLTGSAATSWTAATSVPGNGGTITLSVISRSGNKGRWQQMAWSARTGANETISFSRTVDFSSGLYAPGDQIIARCEVEVDAGSVNLSGPYLRVAENAGGSLAQFNARGFSPPGGAAGPTDAYAGVIETPPITIRPVDMTSGNRLLLVSMNLDVVAALGAASGTARFGRISVCKLLP